jgi:DNA modification methylase
VKSESFARGKYRARLFRARVEQAIDSIEDGCVGQIITGPPSWPATDDGVGVRYAGSHLGSERDMGEYVSFVAGLFESLVRKLAERWSIWLLIDDYAEPGGSFIPVSWHVAQALQCTFDLRAEGLVCERGQYEDVWRRLLVFASYDVVLGSRAWSFDDDDDERAFFPPFPRAFVRRAMKLGSAPNDLIMDPFCGIARVGEVALGMRRHFVECGSRRVFAD